MCGLAGIVRNPKGGEATLEVARAVFSYLVETIETRGHHATGMAAIGGGNPFILKAAVAAREMVASPAWQNALTTLPNDTTMLIGHTRHAYVPGVDQNKQTQAERNAAAHPFMVGNVIGAHNGVIYNWRDVEKAVSTKSDEPLWVDSQAALMALDRSVDPSKALELLDGYFALTWAKRNVFYMARSHEAPLSAAYIPRLMMLLWNSERKLLERVLKWAEIGDEECEVWTVPANTIYRYDAEKFSTKSSGSKKRAQVFTSRRASYGNVDSRRPDRTALSGYWPGSTSMRDTRYQARRYDLEYEQGDWKPKKKKHAVTIPSDAELALMAVEDESKRMEGGRMAVRDFGIALQGLCTHVRAMVKEVKALKARVEALEDEAESPYADPNDATSYDAEVRGQLALTLGCKVCGEVDESAERGKLLSCPDGQYIHEQCVFAELDEEEAVAK